MEIGGISSTQNAFSTDSKLRKDFAVAQKVLERDIEESERKESDGLNLEQVKSLVAEMNEMAKVSSTRISFAYSDEISAIYVKVIDDDSGQVIRQFPSEEAIEFAAKMREWVGMLLDKRI